MHSSCGAPPPQEQYMASIPVGARGSFTLVVTAEHLANRFKDATLPPVLATPVMIMAMRSEEHTSELQSQSNLVCRLLLEKKKKLNTATQPGTRDSPTRSQC